MLFQTYCNIRMYKMTEVRLVLLAVIVSTRGALMSDTAESVEDKIFATDGYDDDGGGSGISELVSIMSFMNFCGKTLVC